MFWRLFNALLVLEQSEILDHNRLLPAFNVAAILDHSLDPVPRAAWPGQFFMYAHAQK